MGEFAHATRWDEGTRHDHCVGSDADPHEYESTTADARAFATAQYVVLNGAGYDSWGDKLLSANPSSSRRLLRVADLLGKKEGDNPHFWYSPDYVNQVVARITNDLVAIDPSGATYYQNQNMLVRNALMDYQQKIANIKQQFAGTKVGATEDVFAYLASASGLNLISPPAFTEAVAEGNDPPTQSVVQFHQQLQSNEVKVLVANKQTDTPLTESVRALAQAQHIPVVEITETLQPVSATFQGWMGSEVNALSSALTSAVNNK